MQFIPIERALSGVNIFDNGGYFFCGEGAGVKLRIDYGSADV